MRYVLTCVIFFGYLIGNFFVLNDYGLNWDEPNHYFRGQAYLRYMLTGKPNYKDLPRLRFHYPKSKFATSLKNIKYEDDSLFRRSIYEYDHEDGQNPFDYYRDSVPSHPPINGLFASFSNYLFYQQFGFLGDIESYHLFIVFTSALLVAAVFLFVSEIYGIIPGIVAVLSLVTYPLFFGESHNNIKDPVEAAFFSLFIFTFYKGIVKEKLRWIILSAIFAGFALGTKFNILFSPFIIVPWFVFYKWNKKKKLRSFLDKKNALYFFIVPAIAFLVLYIFWPHLWYHPFGILDVFKYYGEIGYGTTYQPSNDVIFGINTYAFKWIIFATPLVTLLLTILGIIYVCKVGKKEKTKVSLLIFFWFLVTVFRVMLPHAGIYGGVRQIMEFIPAMAILTGIGWYWLQNLLKSLTKSFFSVASIIIIIVIFLPITLKIISIHPNQSVYFNPLIGGLKGAKEKEFTDWGITLGNQYQQGINWLNTHIEQDANVALVKGLLTNVPRIKIRKDINFSEYYYSGSNKNGEYLMEVVDYRWDHDVPKEKRKYLDTLTPVYEVKVEDVTILTIWKNDKVHTK